MTELVKYAATEPSTSDALLRRISEMRQGVPFTEQVDTRGKVHNEKYISWCAITSSDPFYPPKMAYGFDTTAEVLGFLRLQFAPEEGPEEPFTVALRIAATILTETSGDFYFGSDGLAYIVRRKGRIFLNMFPDIWPPVPVVPVLPPHEIISIDRRMREPWRDL